MWWLVSAIAGIFGVAKAILDALRRQAAKERKQWEDSHRRIAVELEKVEREVAQENRRPKRSGDVQRLATLHRKSANLADDAYKALQGARTTLDALGEAIVKTAVERQAIEQRKRSAPPADKASMEQEIVSLHKLRDEILVPDKDKVKADRDDLKRKLDTLNMATGQLRRELDALRGPRR
jgi:transposase-like protein